MKKILVLLPLVLAIFLLATGEVQAKRFLPQAAYFQQAAKGVATRGVTTTVKFRSDRLAIQVGFSNLAVANSVSYYLTYFSQGRQQAVAGTITAGSPDPTQRELLFGTCSHGVCRYDSGITNAHFVVTTTLKNGAKIVRGFRLKV